VTLTEGVLAVDAGFDGGGERRREKGEGRKAKGERRREKVETRKQKAEN